MAKEGHRVTVFEQNNSIGGRARSYSEDGFTFDMGPSWYWMPDVFEHFFAQFGKQPSDYYDLVQLDPGFQMVFGKDDVVTIPADYDALCVEFEKIESGSSAKLKEFLEEAKYKYSVGMQKMVYKPSFSWMEYANYEVISGAARLQMFTSVSAHVRKYFKNKRLIALMEFPVLFLGAMADRIPALYSMMNYAALSLGTWYPMGGMTRIISGMANLAVASGVNIVTGAEISKLEVKDNMVTGLRSDTRMYAADAVIATGDYHHIEQALLGKEHRNYDEAYWDKKVFAPSSLIFYLGVSKKIDKLIHHNLFFDTSLDEHAAEIYEHPEWPREPLFYLCCPSKTDPTVAPEGMENLFILMPIAPGLIDTPEIREQYYTTIMKRLEYMCGESIAEYVVHKRSYCINDFVKDYHAYKGNAYGLANTLRQTAVLKPTLRNKKVGNLFYAGQLTVPGPGVPPSLISGQIAAEQLSKNLKRMANETVV